MKDEMLRKLLRRVDDSLFEVNGGLGCDLVTGTSAFSARLGRIFAIISNEDDSRIISWTYEKVKGSTPVTQTGLSYLSVKRVDTITLSGSSGTATIVCNGETDTATWNAGGLTLTASDFVTANAADHLAAGTVLTSVANVLYFTAVVAGTDFTGASSGANATGDLAGTAATVTANVLCAVNNDKVIYPDYPLTSITLGKGSFWVYYIL